MENEARLTRLAKCAGCGAKVGAGVLSKLLSGLKTREDADLLVGFDKSDDASVYRVTPELALVQTVDFFPPVTDDPYEYGKIAATNALSDVYAMGGEPKIAQNILIVPKSMDAGIVREILRGGYDAVYEAGALISGGHSINGEEPVYGLCVTGYVHPDRVLKNAGARPGDVLFLTKPLGIGVLLTAMKAGVLSKAGHDTAIALMSALNKAARDVMVNFSVHACTDVTGFSLMGHSVEMADASAVTLSFEAGALPILDEAIAHARMGLLPEGVYKNRAFAEARADLSGLKLEFCDILFDPQTSGGLLIAVDQRDADRFEAALSENVPLARRVGLVLPRAEKAVIVQKGRFL